VHNESKSIKHLNKGGGDEFSEITSESIFYSDIEAINDFR
jgi:hypothetical protein